MKKISVRALPEVLSQRSHCETEGNPGKPQSGWLFAGFEPVNLTIVDPMPVTLSPEPQSLGKIVIKYLEICLTVQC